MAKLTVATALFEMCLAICRSEGWKVHRHLQPHRRDKRRLGEPGYKQKMIKIYPHPNDVLPEKTGLHELIHVRFDLSGDPRDEEITYFMEEYLWKRLTKKQKAQLHDIFVAPLKDSE